MMSGKNFVSSDPNKDVSSIIAEIDKPALLMYGTDERTLDYIPTAEFILERMPQAQLYLFEGKGHLPLFTAQQEFCDVLRHYMLTGEVSN